MKRTLRILVVLAALLFMGGASVDEQHPDTADWPSFSDDKVLEYLDNPFSGVRLYAGQEILRRWDEKKIIALCDKDWKKGQEVLYAGSWPGDGAILKLTFLGEKAPSGNETLRFFWREDASPATRFLMDRLGASFVIFGSPTG